MRIKLLLSVAIPAILTSCSAYKAGQTPDDIYYSPGKPAMATVKENNQVGKYEDYLSQEDDQYLRMKVRNPELWGSIDDYSYWNDSRYVPYYTYNPYGSDFFYNSWSMPYYGYGYYNFGQPYWAINTYGYGLGYGYSYYPGGYAGHTQTYITKRPVGVSRPSLSGYNNRNYYSNSNSLGNTLRRVITPANSSYNNGYTNPNNTYSAPQRSYTPVSSGSYGGGSSSSSGGGGMSRPARGGH